MSTVSSRSLTTFLRSSLSVFIFRHVPSWRWHRCIIKVITSVKKERNVCGIGINPFWVCTGCVIGLPVSGWYFLLNATITSGTNNTSMKITISADKEVMVCAILFQCFVFVWRCGSVRVCVRCLDFVWRLCSIRL